MKKLLGLLVAMCVSFGSVLPALASGSKIEEAKLTKEMVTNLALEAAENYMGIKYNKEKEQVNITEKQVKATKIWSAEIVSKSFMDKVALAEVADDTGRIITLKRENIQGITTENMTKDEENKLASSYIAKLNVKELARLTGPMERVGDIEQNFTRVYAEKVNGIPYLNNTILIEINKSDKKIYNYEFNWEDGMSFEKPEGVISKETAKKSFMDNMTVKPVYTLPLSSRDAFYSNYVNRPRLVYRPYSYETEMLVTANNGELLNLDFTKPQIKRKVDLDEKEKLQLLSKARVNFSNKELSEEEIKKNIETLNNTFLGGTYEIKSLTRDAAKRMKSREQLTFTAFLKNKVSAKEVKIILESMSGEIVYFGSEENVVEKEKKLLYEEGYKRAVAVLGELYEDKIKHVTTTQSLIGETTENGSDYIYRFGRLENNIEFEGNYIDITIGKSSGKPVAINMKWQYNMDFPSEEGMLSGNEVKNIFEELVDMTMYYVKPEEGAKEPRLVYLHNMYIMPEVDAYTAEVYMNSLKSEYTEDLAFQKKFSSNFYFNEFRVLKYNRILEGATFEADKKATKMDVLKMLINYLGYKPSATNIQLKLKNVPVKDQKYVELAVRYGIIKNEAVGLKLSADITREELCEYVLRVTSYGKLCEVKGLMTIKCKDSSRISQDKLGFVAAANALKLVEIKDEFKPKASVTEGEAALMLFRMMEMGIK